jgi:hypothetical protein
LQQQQQGTNVWRWHYTDDDLLVLIDLLVSDSKPKRATMQ